MADIVIMPKLGFDMAEGTLVRWVIAEGSSVEKGAVLAEIETDKATVEVESTFTGTVRRHLVEEGSIVPVNTPIAVIGAVDEEIDLGSLLGEGAPAEAQKPLLEIPVTQSPPEAELSKPAVPVSSMVSKPEVAAEGGQFPGGVKATPLARRMAEELGVDLKQGERFRTARSHPAR